MEKYLNTISESEVALMGAPAESRDLPEARKALSSREFPPPPEGYMAFLRRVNGLCWNGVEFHGTTPVSDSESDYELEDLMEANEAFRETHGLVNRLLIGRADEEYYIYNAEEDSYEVVDATVMDVIASFSDFNALFEDAVGVLLQTEQP